MDHIASDVHKKESQICILAEGGELIASPCSSGMGPCMRPAPLSSIRSRSPLFPRERDWTVR